MIVFFAALLGVQTVSAVPASTPPAIPMYGTALKLGMTSSEVLTALTDHDVHAEVTHAPCVADDLAMKTKVLLVSSSAGHCIGHIRWRVNGDDMMVTFVEDFPTRPGVSVVTEISWNLGHLNSKGDRQIESIVRALGSPSVTDHSTPWQVAMWCMGFSCGEKDMVLSSPRAGPLLVVNRAAGLALTNDRFANDRTNAIQTFLVRRGYRFEE